MEVYDGSRAKLPCNTSVKPLGVFVDIVFCWANSRLLPIHNPNKRVNTFCIMDKKLVDIVNKKIKQMNETESNDVFYGHTVGVF